MASIQHILGKNIKSLRKQKEWSRAFLADTLDISVSFLTMVELGQRGVSLSLIEDIATVFRVPIFFLFIDHDDATQQATMPNGSLFPSEIEHKLKTGINTYLTDFFANII